MTRLALLIGAAVAALGLPGCLGGESDRVGGDRPADTRVLTILDPFSSGSEIATFGSEVARLSHGSLRVRVVNGKDKGPGFEASAIRAIREGRADLAFVGTRAWDEFGVKRLRALSAPMLIDSYPLQRRVLTSDVVEPMLAELRPLGLVGLGILPGFIRRPYGVSHRLAAPRDFRGSIIGTQQSALADRTMRVLGAVPRRQPATVHTVSGLDGLERQSTGIEGDRLDVKGSHLTTNVALWPRPIVVFAGERSYAKLTDDERRILRSAAANVVSRKSASDRRTDAESAQNLCRRGNASFDSATPAELRALRRAVEPVYRYLERDPGTRADIQAIERLKGELAEPPAELASCERPAEEPASGTTTKLDGVWAMDTERSTAGPDYLPENWGHWVFVFDRGRFAITQENKPSCTWGYGKFEVNGNRTSWTFTDGGGIAPSDASNKPGEFFVFDFSAYRDTLKLSPVQGQISPENFRDKPWRRLSDKPTRRYFSKRCPPPADALPD